MPTERELLAEIRSNVLARLNEMTQNPKPNYRVDGEQYAWGDLFEAYMKQMKEIDARLAAMDEQKQMDEPFEFHTRGCPS